MTTNVKLVFTEPIELKTLMELNREILQLIRKNSKYYMDFSHMVISTNNATME